MNTQGSRKRIVLLLAVFAAAIGIYAFSGVWKQMRALMTPPAPPAPQATVPKAPSDIEDLGWVRIDPGPRPSPSMTGIAPERLRAHYRSLYRLKPDRRILYAVEELDRIVAGRRNPATLSVRFEDDHWSLRLEKEPVGSLSEVPAFADEDRLLRDWAANRLAKYGWQWDSIDIPELEPLSADLEQGSAIRTIAALRALNGLAAAHPRNAKLFQAAARGSIWLAVQSYDALQLTDPLVGHALALLILAQAGAPGTMVGDQALLLFQMGYESAAERAGAALDSHDPIAAYVNFDSGALAAAAASKTATPRTQYLHLRDLIRRVGRERWFEEFRRTRWAREVSPSSLGSILSFSGWNNPLAATALTADMLIELEVASEAESSRKESLWSAESWPDEALEQYLSAVRPQLPSPPESQTRQFEQLLDRRAAAADGPIYDSESERAFYRAGFYSGIFGSATYLMDMQGVMDSAERFGSGMADAAPGTASQLKSWILKRVANSRSAKVPQDILPVLESWDRIGTWPVAYVASRVAFRAASRTDPVLRAMQRIVFRRLDMRPHGLLEGGRAARFDLLDLASCDRYVRTLVGEAPVTGGDLVVSYAYWARDERRLQEIAADRRQPGSNRSLSLELLQRIGKADLPFLEAKYQELMDDEPENWHVLDDCVAMYQEAGDVARGDKVIARWLARRPVKEHDLTWAHVLSRRAHLYASKKRWSEAWRAIEPAVPSWKEEVLESAAWILEERGLLDGALEMERRTLKRYPDDRGLPSMIARILWRQKKNAEAAEALTSSILGRWDWEHTVARDFATVFADADPHDAQNAFTALRDRKVDTNRLVPLARAVGDKGNHKLAFALLAGLPAGGSSDDSAVKIFAHDELEKSDGKEAAAEWLRKNTHSFHELAGVAFQFQRYEILAEPLEDPARPRKDDEVQIMRTAAVLMTPEPAPQRREELLHYFESSGRQNDFVTYGTYLLGKRDKPKQLLDAGTDEAVATTAWVAALKATDERRYDEASDWFEVSVQTDQVRVPPQAWSYDMLRRWEHQARLLSDFTPEIALARSP